MITSIWFLFSSLLKQNQIYFKILRLFKAALITSLRNASALGFHTVYENKLFTGSSVGSSVRIPSVILWFMF